MSDGDKRGATQPAGLTRRDFLCRAVCTAAAAVGLPAAAGLLAAGCRPGPRSGPAGDLARTASTEEAGVVSSYLSLSPAEFDERVSHLKEMMRSCTLCPRACGANRLAGETGICRVDARPVVAAHDPHLGEEPPLVGRRGSGTVFLTHCNLHCVFCINHQISQGGAGRRVSIERLADMMVELQSLGCHNINWVTPTHQVPMLVEALQLAAERGLRLPVVYNCGGYESVAALKLLDGIVDIYMPDAKYSDNEMGRRFSSVPDYWDRSREALAEMHRQVGDLQLDWDGLATRGLLVRHLVMPNDVGGTAAVMEFIASLSRDTYVNVMSQYTPVHQAHRHPEIARRITPEEFEAAMQAARTAGLHRFARG